ncbi:MAG: diguanylate cyclase [Methylophaga sp.]|nr:diguanylate cyclase [Methylophaga sp.]
MDILIVDDSELDNLICSKFVEVAEFNPKSASSAQEAMHILATSEFPPEVIVIDWMMPDMDGIELCKAIRQINLSIRPYIIMITASLVDDIEMDALESGADDFIEKPLSANKFIARLKVGYRLITTQKKLIELAHTDVLTGLLNRRAAMIELEKNLARLFRISAPAEHSLIICDIDHFKKINDVYGHSAGDEVLIEVAKRLADTIRPFENVSRIGGEEFLIYCEASRDVIDRILQRLKDNISQKPISIGDASIQVTMSFGCVMISNAAPQLSLDFYIRMADELLYEMKRAGRNGYKIAIAESKPTQSKSVSPE